jgi:hypothetical protein
LARGYFSEAYAGFSLAVSLAALALALLLLFAIAALRIQRRWHERRIARAEPAWRAALHLATEEGSPELPPVAAALLPDFIGYWNRVRASLKGAAGTHLSALLRQHGIDSRLLDLLEARSLRLRLLAATALGFLRDKRAWDALARIARGPSAPLSFTAAQALIRIEPAAAIDLLAADLVAREDWSVARLGGLFRELGPDVVTEPLARIIAARPGKGAHRIVKLARYGERTRMGAAVREWLQTSDDPEVLAAALEYAENAEYLPVMRGAARHPDWRVRMAAARALGRVGSRPELATLLQLLRDPRWWVRYHAAQAVTRLHGLAPAEIETLRRDSPDAFAADMLAQAIADRGPAP